MKPYVQRVPAGVNRYLSPEQFEMIRRKSILEALQKIQPHERTLLIALAEDLYQKISAIDINFSRQDAIVVLAAIGGFQYCEESLGEFSEPLPDSKKNLFFALVPRRLKFEDLDEENIEYLVTIKPKQISKEFGINYTEASNWYARARAIVNAR